MSDLRIKAPVPFEPKKKNRWIMRFPTDLGISEWTLKSCSLPSINTTSTEIQFLNTSNYVAGRFVWENVNVTLRDFIAPSTSQAVMEWVRLCSESITGRQGYAAGYKRDVELELLDPTGVAVSKWVLKGAWISQCNMGNLDYGDDGINEISLTIIIDYAILAY